MKKMIALLLAVCLMLTMGSALAETSVEEQLAQTVKSLLDEEDYIYEYDADDLTFTMTFEIESVLKDAEVTIYLYDDMLSVTVDAPIQVPADRFEKMAIFTTLVNNDIYYAQFRVDQESGWITCRSCNVIEGILPSEAEVITLLSMPVIYMEVYGDAIAAICNDNADPYEAYKSCQN